MRIGLYGGTFNPIHHGHLRAAKEIAEGVPLDRVTFIPAAEPPHKSDEHLAPAEDRLNMIRLAVKGEPRLAASDVEIRRSGKSYSVDTLRQLRAEEGSGSAFYLILGMDAFEEIATWKDYESLFRLCHIIVTSRPGTKRRPLRELIPEGVLRRLAPTPGEEAFTSTSGMTVTYCEVTPVDVSSTRIREAVRRGASIREWVPDAVREYIETKRLYRD